MKFIHTADLHLGSSFLSSSFDKNTAKERREDLFKAFNKLIAACKKREADLLLIAGDLFEDELVRASDVNRIIDGFKMIPEVKVVIAAGNHDYIHEKSFYKLLTFPKNVTIFDSDTLDKIEFDDINTCVYGLSFLKKHYEEDILEVPELDYSKNNILVLHCDAISKASDYLPIDKNKLADSGFDYCALGHIHKSVKLSNNSVYPGSLEPLDFSETGYHGYIYGEIVDKKVGVKLIKSNIKQFVSLDVNVTSMESLEEIINVIKTEAKIGLDKFLFRVNIEGTLSDLVKMEDIKTRLNEEFYYIEVIDSTTVDYNIAKIYAENKDNVIGHYMKALKGKDDEIDMEALYLGLDALLNEGAK
ncbi:metallophosphoesterase family protein [Anaerofustis stercorihominis]|nr:DNA repair exonuclease [Anaerofustis stercorihominis]MCQ4795387.1 DNA repair exonuclease [Anaerofustis stercorihominis]RGD75564.1 DNA repair exonuclease [Anaerofustis stercorihominis]